MKKILFVDDEANVLHAIRRNLPSEYDAFFCEKPEEALKLLENNEFNVVVSDINMPGINGIEFVKRVNKIAPDTIRVILSGYTSLEHTLNAINHGNVYRFISKPVSRENLIAVIEDCLDHYETLQSKKKLFALLQIKDQMVNMIHTLTKVTEIRDPYTCGHQERVAEMAVKTAHKLNWKEDRITGLHLAALVHDIGKISVPVEFLNKPGQLSENELAIIKQHPTTGYDIIRESDFMWPIAEIIFQHHERLDGTGYPNGISGDKLLDEAQIISVCDIYDAMCHRRPYREGLGPDAAITHIKEVSGKYFRSDIVDAFISAISAQQR